jgi:hypothetical protein
MQRKNPKHYEYDEQVSELEGHETFVDAKGKKRKYKKGGLLAEIFAAFRSSDGRSSRSIARDRMFVSQQEHEKNYRRKTAGKRYKATGGEAGDEFATGGRTSRGLARDRMFVSQQEHEKNYRRKTAEMPFFVMGSKSADGKYYVSGDGSHYVPEEELTLATEADFNAYYGPNASKGFTHTIFKTGGFVGKAEMVWRDMSISERIDFLRKNFTPQITPASQELLTKKAYQFLPTNVKQVLAAEYANVEFSKFAPYDPVYESEMPGAMDYIPEEDRAMAEGGLTQATWGGIRGGLQFKQKEHAKGGAVGTNTKFEELYRRANNNIQGALELYAGELGIYNMFFGHKVDASKKAKVKSLQTYLENKYAKSYATGGAADEFIIVSSYWGNKEDEKHSEKTFKDYVQKNPIKNVWIGLKKIDNFKFDVDNNGRMVMRYSLKKGSSLKYYVSFLDHSVALKNNNAVFLWDINYDDWNNKILTKETLELLNGGDYAKGGKFDTLENIIRKSNDLNMEDWEDDAINLKTGQKMPTTLLTKQWTWEDELSAANDRTLLGNGINPDLLSDLQKDIVLEPINAPENYAQDGELTPTQAYTNWLRKMGAAQVPSDIIKKAATLLR